MALTFYELAPSREFAVGADGQTYALEWIAFWSADYTAVRAALQALAGTAGDGLPVLGTEASHQGGGVWRCKAEYDFRAPQSIPLAIPAALDAPYAVELTAAQLHVTQSKQTVYSAGLGAGGTGYWQTTTTYAAGQKVTANGNIYRCATPGTSSGGGTGPAGTGTGIPDGGTGLTWDYVQSTVGAAPDYKRAIGVTRDRVQGVDVFAPKFEFSVTNKHSNVGFPTLKYWYSLVAHTNRKTFKTFQPGEVLYLGSSGRAVPGGYWVATHRFAASPNLTGVQVSPDFKVDKKGWEYVWATYGPQRIANSVLQLPTNVYVERVYDEGDFDLLGISGLDAGFTASPASGPAPLFVQFADASGGTPVSWAWAFGDGGTDVAQNPSHTYAAAGVYTVSLTVQDAAANTSTATQTITVS